MDVNLMAQRLTNHDRAVKAQRRRAVEQTLTCAECGRANKPGSQPIDVDEHDDAQCECGYIWQVRIEG